jgi:hypothetical protein
MKRQNYEINVILWKTKDIMQYALKLQLVFLLPEYIKLIFRDVFYMHMQT